MSGLESWPVAMAGGALIGLGAVVLMALAGRIAGISGILGGALPPGAERNPGWRWAFLAGLVVGPLPIVLTLGTNPLAPPLGSLPELAAAGLLVGIGTGLGQGCTSGHGVCGLARLSGRSLAATVTFMVVAMATVFVVHHGIHHGL